MVRLSPSEQGADRAPLSTAEHTLYTLSVPSLAAPCTESLTPLLALLPCTNHAGLGTLLNPHKLFDGEWTNLQIGFTRTEEGAEVGVEVGTVADPVRAERLKGGLGKRGEPTGSRAGRGAGWAVRQHSGVGGY